MRGKLLAGRVKDFYLRITPARAGKTCILADDDLVGKDHPRACGENVLCGFSAFYHGGSPPRVRGKRLAARQGRRDGGITPARAGKTKHICGQHLSCEDHPRACGENWKGTRADRRQVGSPPRVRGKPQRMCTAQSQGRITPARAGKTWQWLY